MQHPSFFHSFCSIWPHVVHYGDVHPNRWNKQQSMDFFHRVHGAVNFAPMDDVFYLSWVWCLLPDGRI